MTTTTNTTTITDDQIQALRDEAHGARDYEQVRLCELALRGDRDAWRACADAIEDARASESPE